MCVYGKAGGRSSLLLFSRRLPPGMLTDRLTLACGRSYRAFHTLCLRKQSIFPSLQPHHLLHSQKKKYPSLAHGFFLKQNKMLSHAPLNHASAWKTQPPQAPEVAKTRQRKQQPNKPNKNPKTQAPLLTAFRQRQKANPQPSWGGGRALSRSGGRVLPSPYLYHHHPPPGSRGWNLLSCPRPLTATQARGSYTNHLSSSQPFLGQRLFITQTARGVARVGQRRRKRWKKKGLPRAYAQSPSCPSPRRALALSRLRENNRPPSPPFPRACVRGPRTMGIAAPGETAEGRGQRAGASGLRSPPPPPQSTVPAIRRGLRAAQRGRSAVLPTPLQCRTLTRSAAGPGPCAGRQRRDRLGGRELQAGERSGRPRTNGRASGGRR